MLRLHSANRYGQQGEYFFRTQICLHRQEYCDCFSPERTGTCDEGWQAAGFGQYLTVTQTAKVTYAVYMEDKAVTPQRSMTRQTDFNWTDAVKLPAECEGRTVTLKATATFKTERQPELKASLLIHPLLSKSRQATTGPILAETRSMWP